MRPNKPQSKSQQDELLDIITELIANVVKPREQLGKLFYGTQHTIPAIQSLIDKTVEAKMIAYQKDLLKDYESDLIEARIDELERLTFVLDNTRKSMDESEEDTSHFAIKLRLAELKALGDKG